MDETKLLEAIQALGAALRTEVADSIAKISERCDAMADAMAKSKTDNDGDDDMAQQTAADSAVRSDLAYVKAALRDLQIKQPTRRPPTDLDALAEMQSRCDAAFIANGSRAEMPMQGEGLVEYTVRMHRKLQRHSAKFAKAELAQVARDPATFQQVCDSIRADALTAGLNPVGLPQFRYREIKTESPGGHKITSFVGNGSIFAQLSRPVRHVRSIGADDRYPRSGGGAVYAAQ
jgi:hypothetical protein